MTENERSERGTADDTPQPEHELEMRVTAIEDKLRQLEGQRSELDEDEIKQLALRRLTAYPRCHESSVDPEPIREALDQLYRDLPGWLQAGHC